MTTARTFPITIRRTRITIWLGTLALALVCQDDCDQDKINDIDDVCPNDYTEVKTDFSSLALFDLGKRLPAATSVSKIILARLNFEN